MKKNLFVYAAAALCAVGLTYPLTTHTSWTGSIAGNVNDPSLAAVPGATVVVSGHHLSRRVSTDAQGNFQVAGLKPGLYKVSVVSNGFSTAIKRDLVLPGDRSELDATLAIAPLQQSITVTAADQALATE